MLRAPLALLLLCACVARTADDSGDDESSDDDTTTWGNDTPGDGTVPETTSASVDDSSGPSTATVTITSTTGEPLPVSFDGDIQPIFDEHCVTACHEPAGEWGFLLDLSGSAYDAIVGVPAPQFVAMSLVEPGVPLQSYLWHKLSGTQPEIGGSGLMMPKARSGMTPTVLEPEQLAAIEQWILQDAPP